MKKFICFAIILFFYATVQSMEENNRALFKAAYEKNCVLVHQLLASGADSTLFEGVGELKQKTPEEKKELLFQAVTDGNTLHVKRLLLAGADSNAFKDWYGSPLYIAAEKGHADCAKVLLMAGADKEIVFKKGSTRHTPLHRAANGGHAPCVDLLLKAEANPTSFNENGFMPIHVAASGGCTDCVSLFLAAGLDVDILTRDGSTPLDRAAFCGHLQCLNFLLQKGARADRVEEDGWTPLHSIGLNCTSEEELECARLLLKAGANPDIHHQQNLLTPLGYAALHGRHEFLKLILAAGVNKNPRNFCGRTPLHHAACGKREASEESLAECVRTLLEAGADYTLMDDKGRTAGDVARTDIARAIFDEFMSKQN